MAKKALKTVKIFCKQDVQEVYQFQDHESSLRYGTKLISDLNVLPEQYAISGDTSWYELPSENMLEGADIIEIMISSNILASSATLELVKYVIKMKDDARTNSAWQHKNVFFIILNECEWKKALFNKEVKVTTLPDIRFGTPISSYNDIDEAMKEAVVAIRRYIES